MKGDNRAMTQNPPDWMSDGHTAVITGAAGGIGFETARRFAAAGMNVVLADIKDSLATARDALIAETGAADRIMAQACDVSQFAEVEALRDAVLARFGKVHCLMNNAGIATRGAPPWEALDGLNHIMGINFMGVVHGCHAFIPSMLAHGEPGAVINTGSKQGITRPPGNTAYNLSKAGVVAYTEAVAHGFVAEEDCRLTAHLLVPAFVYTPMIEAFIPEKPGFAATTEETVDYFMDELNGGSFYIICPDGETNRTIDEKRIQWNVDDIIKNRPAMSRWHPEYQAAFKVFMEEE